MGYILKHFLIFYLRCALIYYFIKKKMVLARRKRINRQMRKALKQAQRFDDMQKEKEELRQQILKSDEEILYSVLDIEILKDRMKIF